MQGRLATVQYFLQYGADVNQKDKFGYTPLVAAAGNGHLAVVRLLLGHGADPATVSEDGSALTLALKNHHDDVAQALQKLRAPEQLKSEDELDF